MQHICINVYIPGGGGEAEREEERLGIEMEREISSVEMTREEWLVMEME